jgi:hypothetical protein
MFLVNSYLSFKCHPTQKDAYLLTQFIVLTQGCALSRVIGPAMPSRELLAAAAEMTEALRSRDAEVEADDGFLIGPPPPAMVAEAASANEAERFEEVHFQ